VFRLWPETNRGISSAIRRRNDNYGVRNHNRVFRSRIAKEITRDSRNNQPIAVRYCVFVFRYLINVFIGGSDRSPPLAIPWAISIFSRRTARNLSTRWPNYRLFRAPGLITCNQTKHNRTIRPKNGLFQGHRTRMLGSVLRIDRIKITHLYDGKLSRAI